MKELIYEKWYIELRNKDSLYRRSDRSFVHNLGSCENKVLETTDLNSSLNFLQASFYTCL